MKRTNRWNIPIISSYWEVFRIIFVLFSLYLLGDVFYRWDGFRYHSTFSEFLPSVALITILWSIVAMFVAVLIWPLLCFSKLSRQMGSKIRMEPLLFFVSVYGLLLTADWLNTKLTIIYHIKQIVFFCRDLILHYASSTEFLPIIVLVFILLSSTVVFIWFALRGIKFICHRIGWEIKMKQLILFLCVSVLSITVVGAWGKKILINELIGYKIQLSVRDLIIFCIVIFLTWLYRNKAEQWIGIIRERITPLVWLFGIWVMLSVILVAYHTSWSNTYKAVPQIDKSTEADKNLPNILLVTYDALTAREMSAYGYHRPTTPFISKWAKTASLFKRVQADSNFTTATTASLMTGKRGWTHRILQTDASVPIKSDIENLPLLLRNRGYYNMVFNVNVHSSVERLDIADSFDFAPPRTELMTPRSWYGTVDKLLFHLFGEDMKFYDWIIKPDFILVKLLRLVDLYPPEFSTTEVPPEKSFNKFLTAIDNNLHEPFFAWIHLYPPHDPYLPPDPYIGLFDSSPRLRTFRDIGWNDKALLEVARARYDEFIRYCDSQFKDFITQLEKRNMLKNTIVILSSDHGESFEHDFLTHGGPHLYEQLTHIPLVIKEPDQSEGRIIYNLVGQIDIPATILDLASIPVPLWMEGRSLMPLLQGEKIPSKPVYSMNFWLNPGRGHKLSRGTVAVWEGDYKLIHYLDKDKSLLFNLKEDSGESKNLFNEEPEIGHHLLNLIQHNLKKSNDNN